MRYCCEFCGKTFVKEEEALVCERKHTEDQERQRELKAERKRHSEEIENKYKELNELIKKYYDDYHISWYFDF